MNITPEIQDRVDIIAKDLRDIVTVAYTKGSKNLQYQDCMNVALFIKLAELELKIEKLTKKTPYEEINNFIADTDKPMD